MTLRGVKEFREALSEELHGSGNAKIAALRLLDEFLAKQRSHLRMGKVKIGDFLQKNAGSVVPIALNGVLLLEIDDQDPENYENKQVSTDPPETSPSRPPA